MAATIRKSRLFAETMAPKVDQENGEGEQDSAARDLVANPARQKRAKLLPESAHGGWFDCTPLRYNFFDSPPSDDNENCSAVNMSQRKQDTALESLPGALAGGHGGHRGSAKRACPGGATDRERQAWASPWILPSRSTSAWATRRRKNCWWSAYAARIISLAERNLDAEARALLELVQGRHPSSRDRLREVAATLKARGGGIEGLLELLADPSLPAEKTRRHRGPDSRARRAIRRGSRGAMRCRRSIPCAWRRARWFARWRRSPAGRWRPSRWSCRKFRGTVRWRRGRCCCAPSQRSTPTRMSCARNTWRRWSPRRRRPAWFRRCGR